MVVFLVLVHVVQNPGKSVYFLLYNSSRIIETDVSDTLRCFNCLLIDEIGYWNNS
jgi:hypothetical protein